jgi:CHAD domain-containing protein
VKVLTNGLEHEAKFDIDLDFALPDLRKAVGGTVRLPEKELQAVYFDTPDFRLWCRGITFRHRTGEEPETGIWTLKLPRDSSGPTFDRSELTWAGTREDLPSEALRILKGIVRRSTLVPIAELTTMRRRLALYGSKGRSVGELDDDIVTVHRSNRDTFRFRQVEVEFETTRKAVIDAVVEEFRTAGVSLSNEPKLAKALDLPPHESKRRAAIGLGRKSTLGDLVSASIADATDKILDRDYRLRLDPASPRPEDVHQARVATRRLRSNLNSFGAPLDPVWLRNTRSELKWLGGVLGDVRDIDVLEARIDKDRHDLPVDTDGANELGSALMAKRQSGSRRLAEALTSDRYLVLLDRLDAASHLPPFLARSRLGEYRRPVAEDLARRALPSLIGKQWREVRRQVRTSGRTPTDHELHRIRIRSKQLRYGAEAAGPIVGKPARRLATAAERLQTVLGEHQDTVTAQQWLRRQAKAGPWAASFAAGQLSEVQAQRQRRLRREWRAGWLKLRRKKVRGWLD